jgi:hypothetical protein
LWDAIGWVEIKEAVGTYESPLLDGNTEKVVCSTTGTVAKVGIVHGVALSFTTVQLKKAYCVFNQGWPKFAARLWMATGDAGIAALSYAPCRVQALVADSVPVSLTVETAYPFNEDITISVHLPGPTHSFQTA